MDREERRLKRQQDTKSAAIVMAVLAVILIVVIVAAVFCARHFLGLGSQKKPQQETEQLQDGTENVGVPETETAEAMTDEDLYYEQAVQLVSGMSLEDKVAQMFVITPDALTGYAGVTAAGDTTKEAYDKRPVGGIIYSSSNLTDSEQTKTMLSNMQTIAKEKTGLPAFLGVIEEGGSVNRIAGNAGFSVTDVGNMSDIGATGDVQNAYNAGSTIGTYLSELGFNMDYAPVADVLTNSSNTEIATRSFGSDASAVADMVSSELQGLESQGIFGVVKYFPGLGDTTGDSHTSVVTSQKTLEELTATELVPFQRAIDDGASFIMVGHIALPNITGDDVPASLSSKIVTDLLRTQMGYNGIVVTDAMTAGSITDTYNSDVAAVMAVNAGVDIILLPADYDTAYNAVLAAVSDGSISEDRIDESVVRIVKKKLELGQ